MPRPDTSPAHRYVHWLGRRGAWILLAGFLVLQAALYLAVFHLPLRADFSHLLPQDAPSVRDLRRLESRLAAQDMLLVIIEAPSPQVRQAVAKEMAAAIRALPPTLVERVEEDDAETRAFLREHRHLYVPLPDLIEARDALGERIKRAKLAANPAYIDLDEEETAAADAAARRRLDDLRQRRKQAEARLDHSSHVTADGLTQQLVVFTGFTKTDADRGEELLAAVRRARDQVLAVPGRAGTEIGLAGGVTAQAAEHRALVRGMIRSGIVTAVLVTLVLLLYFRSFRLLGLIAVAPLVATLAAFGAAVFTVGHLNPATAFLGVIIAGNGINYGIFLVARFLIERRHKSPEAAMAEAISATVNPTIVASLGAAIAYGALAATSFRGFADFAVIGAVGMILCWIASYTLLPVMVLRWGPRLQVSTSDPVLGTWMARVLGFRRAGVVCALAAGVAIVAGIASWRFIAADPYEYDIKELRSRGPEALEFRRWATRSDEAFGRGISGQTFIAADRLEQVPQIVDALGAVDREAPPDGKTIGVVRSILDVMPRDQKTKISVLRQIREQLDAADLDELGADERAEVEALRPPAEIQPITAERLPVQIQNKLREADGRLGYLVAVRPDLQLDEWDAHDLIRFAAAVRTIRLEGGETVTTSGPLVIYADIIQTIQADAPVVVAVAGALLVLMVLLVVGRNRLAFAVLAATALGSLLLIAVCGLFDLKVTFLDFIALPITLGLGIDYAINMASRRKDGRPSDPLETLRTSGASVLICSLTTIIGYGSLLVSENLAIRGFGTVSLIGEICCASAALVVVPALIGLRRRSVDRVGLDAGRAFQDPLEVVDQHGRVPGLVAGIPDHEADGEHLAGGDRRGGP